MRQMLLTDNRVSWLDLGTSFDQVNLTQPLLIRKNKHVRSVVSYLKHYEPYTLQTLMAIFSTECTAGQPPLFVDSGANEGIWSLLAAAHGCRAVAIEPQPLCVSWLQGARLKNGNALAERLAILNAILSPAPSTVRVRADDCNQEAQYLPDGTLATANRFDAARYARQLQTSPRVNVSALRLDALLSNQQLPACDSLQRGSQCTDYHRVSRWIRQCERVAIWHVDVEGAEILVLRSASTLLKRGVIQRVMIESNPKRWSRFNVSVDEGLATARQVFSGWTCMIMCSGVPYAWDRPLRSE